MYLQDGYGDIWLQVINPNRRTRLFGLSIQKGTGDGDR
jgi:hypothetical protein